MPNGNRSRRLVNSSSECAYCRQVATTRDHVIPKNLFTSPRPADMITVACCARCNREKERTDSFLRDFLVCNADAPPNEVADSIRSGSYQSAVDNNRSELWKHIKQSDKLQLEINGNDIGSFIAIPFGSGLLKDSMVFMTKGVFYWLNENRIPDDHAFLVGGIPDIQALGGLYESLKRLGQVGSAKIGDNKVFSCFLQTYYEGEIFQASVWGFLFFNRTYIGCISLAPSLRDRMSPECRKQF